MGRNASRPETLRSRRLHGGEPGSEWLVAGRLPVGGTSLLVGGPRVGKSSLARGLALAVARGSPWLSFETRAGPVLYVSVGGTPAAARQSFDAVGLGVDDPVHVLPVRAGAGALECIRDCAKAVEPALVIVDPLEPLLEADELNDLRVSPLDRILHRGHPPGAHLMLVHAPAGGTGSGLSALLASTPRAIDTIFVLRRSGERRLLYSVQRKGADIRRPLLLPCWERPRPALEGGAEGGVDPDVRSEVLGYLRRASRLVTLREIFDYAGYGEPEVLATLERLKQRGEVLEVSGNGGPVLYTGCDVVPGAGSWLRRVRPWAVVPEDLA